MLGNIPRKELVIRVKIYSQMTLSRLAGARSEIGLDMLRIDGRDFDQLDERLAAVVQSQQILPCDLQ